jgi:hypothetical protein
MTSPIITVSSIRPTTFVEAPLTAAATLAVAALAVAVLGVTQTMAASASAASAARLRAAELMPRGYERDSLLFEAQVAISDAAALAPKDAALQARAARTLYLQAATASLPDISMPLLEAADAAAARALAASPSEAGAPATQALIAFARNNFVPSAEGAAFVAQAYAARARDPETQLWRVQAAGAQWPALDAATRNAAADEACALQRAPATQARVDAAIARMGEGFGVCPVSRS